MIKYFFGLFLLFSSSLSTSDVLARPNSEASQAVRDVIVLKKLRAHPKTILVYAKGLCCASCAIGVRKKVSQLNFVDQSRLETGIKLDVQHQLVLIALKDDQRVDPKMVSQAIDDAGYTPVHLYILKDDKVITTQLKVN